MFGDTPAETDDQSTAPTDMPEDSDVQPPDVYENNADAVQEAPAPPKPKRTSRKKKEAAAPEKTVTEEVPAETTESADTADTILDTEEPAVEPDVPVVEEAAAPAPTPSPPRRQPRPQQEEIQQRYFQILPLAPPEIGIPPNTRAIRICVSNWLPPEDVTDPTLITLINAANPVSAPASTYMRNFILSVRIPENIAAFSPAPIAFKYVPNFV